MFMAERRFLLTILTVINIVWVVAEVSAQDIVPPRSLRGQLLELQARLNSVTDGGAPEEIGLVPLFAQLMSLETSTAPTGTSSGGFTFTFDKELGTFNRSTQTFGPAFGKRSTTLGKGKGSAGVNWLHASYDSIGGMNLLNGDLRLAKNTVGFGFDGSYSEGMITLSSDTTVGFANFGISNDLDIGISVPWIRMSLAVDVALFNPAQQAPLPDGTIILIPPIDITPAGRPLLLPTTTAAGVGDIAIFGKYRFWRQGEGGLATELAIHLPTGDTNELRGTGVTRTLISMIWSRGGIVSPHANLGYEFWSRGVHIGEVSAKNQIVYGAGLEILAHSRATILADVIGRRQLNAGQLGYRNIRVDEVRSLDLLVGLPEDLDVVSFAPGIKWNVAGNVLLIGHLLATIENNGLRSNITPAFGVDWAF